VLSLASSDQLGDARGPEVVLQPYWRRDREDVGEVDELTTANGMARYAG